MPDDIQKYKAIESEQKGSNVGERRACADKQDDKDFDQILDAASEAEDDEQEGDKDDYEESHILATDGGGALGVENGMASADCEDDNWDENEEAGGAGDGRVGSRQRAVKSEGNETHLNKDEEGWPGFETEAPLDQSIASEQHDESPKSSNEETKDGRTRIPRVLEQSPEFSYERKDESQEENADDTCEDGGAVSPGKMPKRGKVADLSIHVDASAGRYAHLPEGTRMVDDRGKKGVIVLGVFYSDDEGDDEDEDDNDVSMHALGDKSIHQIFFFVISTMEQVIIVILRVCCVSCSR